MVGHNGQSSCVPGCPEAVVQHGLQQRGFRLAVRLLVLALQAGGEGEVEEHVALALQAIKMQLNEVRAGCVCWYHCLGCSLRVCFSCCVLAPLPVLVTARVHWQLPLVKSLSWMVVNGRGWSSSRCSTGRALTQASASAAVGAAAAPAAGRDESQHAQHDGHEPGTLAIGDPFSFWTHPIGGGRHHGCASTVIANTFTSLCTVHSHCAL